MSRGSGGENLEGKGGFLIVLLLKKSLKNSVRDIYDTGKVI